MSTNYPEYYKHYSKCEWEITASDGHLVVLTFLDFALESNDNCGYDYVELSEQVSNNKKVIAKLCGEQGLNKTYRSSGSKMLVKFRSDGSRRLKGFKASFKQGVLEFLHTKCFYNMT